MLVSFKFHVYINGVNFVHYRQAEPKCTALWVGNVDPQLVTEKQMMQLFSKCGKVGSVRILPHKYCAFVNYSDSNSAVMAMEKLQVGIHFFYFPYFK